jgi:hypothetical protein
MVLFLYLLVEFKRSKNNIFIIKILRITYGMTQFMFFSFNFLKIRMNIYLPKVQLYENFTKVALIVAISVSKALL